MAATQSWLIGSGVVLSCTWHVPPVPTGTPTDPTTVTLKIKTPDGVVTSYVYPSAPVVKDGAGAYHANYVPATAGHYGWRWEGTGTAQAPDEGTFDITPSGVS